MYQQETVFDRPDGKFVFVSAMASTAPDGTRYWAISSTLRWTDDEGDHISGIVYHRPDGTSALAYDEIPQADDDLAQFIHAAHLAEAKEQAV